MEKQEVIETFVNDIVTLLKEQALESGQEISGDLREVADYAAERAEHLSTRIGSPGFSVMLREERDGLLLKAATVAVMRADEFDRRIEGAISATLTILSRALQILATAA